MRTWREVRNIAWHSHWIRIQKIWNRSGVRVWKSDSGHLWCVTVQTTIAVKFELQEKHSFIIYLPQTHGPYHKHKRV